MSSDPTLRPPFAELHYLPKPASDTAHRSLAEASRQHILEVLHETKWVLGGCQGASAQRALPWRSLV